MFCDLSVGDEDHEEPEVLWTECGEGECLVDVFVGEDVGGKEGRYGIDGVDDGGWVFSDWSHV